MLHFLRNMRTGLLADDELISENTEVIREMENPRIRRSGNGILDTVFFSESNDM